MDKHRLSDGQKLLAISLWVATRGAVVAFAYVLLKAGQYVVRFV